MTIALRKSHIAALSAALTLTLAACADSSDGDGGASGGDGKPAAEVDVAAYDGPDAAAFENGTIEKPEDKGVSDCEVGYLQAYAGQVNLVAMQDAASEALSAYGCTMTALDGQLNPQTQVSQFEQFLVQGMDAVILMPIADTALQPLLEKAKAAGMPVIAFNMPGDLSQPRNELIATNVASAFDLACYAVMKMLADSRPGSTFAIMGTAIPSNQLQYMIERYQYWGEELGLKFLGKVDALDDNPNAFTPALQSIFSKWPEVDNLVSYSDDFALTAASVAAQQGASRVHIVDSNGGADAIVPAIEAGKVFGTYFVPWAEAGEQMGYAAYAAITGQSVPETVVLKSNVVHKGNLDDYEFVS